MLEEVVKVFISYSWDSEEHKKKVLALAESLRRHGIDCQIDRYHVSPPEGWYRWMMNQIEESDFVLVICTEKYSLRYCNKEERGRGRGATWEGGLIISELYDGQGVNDKFIPVLLSPDGEQHIPRSLKPYTVYRLFSSENYDLNKPGCYQSLYRHLTNQPAYKPAKLGQPQVLLPVGEAPSTVGNHGEIIQAENLIVAEERAEWRQNQLAQHQVEEQAGLHQAEQLRLQAAEVEILEQREKEQQQQAQFNQEAEKEQQQHLLDNSRDFTQLEELLKAKKWKEADEQTKRIVLITNQNNSLRTHEIRQLPLDFLYSLNQYWVEYSDGKFGLRIQHQLWQKILEPEKPRWSRLNPFAKKAEPLTDSQAWTQFRCLVGWYNDDEKRYVDTKPDCPVNAPDGCFPRTRLWLHGGHYGSAMQQFVALMERVSQLE